jgi:hypothetical protein
MKKPWALTFAAAVLLSGCGYFNSLYNARREFADAERMRATGRTANARQAYIGSIEKAAKSYRKYPNGRWSDDALYLIGRSRFQLAEYPAARAAFTELLTKTSDRDIRAGAHAYLGAAQLNLAAPAEALTHLDSAIVQLNEGSELTGFARLWRARARAAIANFDGAWEDLDAVTNTGDAEYGAVQLDRVRLALSARDSARAAASFAGLLVSRNIRRQLDTVAALAATAHANFGAAATRAWLAESHTDLPDAPRDSLSLIRARIAARDGDTVNAHRELMQLASSAALPTASAARILVARSRIGSADKLETLGEIRTMLLPAITHPEAQRMIQTLRVVDVLVQRSAATGQPLALFTAGEIARDELGAPLLARRLFTTFVDIAPQSPWSGKAVLAAIAIAPNTPEAGALRNRLASLPANPYTTITNGEGAGDAYDLAEERLARSMVVLREEAVQLAAQQGDAVTRAIAVLDSLTVAARTDTLRVACGMMLDSLAIKGMRADSVRVACMRSDTARIAVYLKTDTAVWLPGYTPRDSTQLRGRRRVTPTRPVVADSTKQ